MDCLRQKDYISQAQALENAGYSTAEDKKEIVYMQSY